MESIEASLPARSCNLHNLDNSVIVLLLLGILTQWGQRISEFEYDLCLLSVNIYIALIFQQVIMSVIKGVVSSFVLITFVKSCNDTMAVLTDNFTINSAKTFLKKPY